MRTEHHSPHLSRPALVPVAVGIAATLSAKWPDNPVTLEESPERITRLVKAWHSPELWLSDVAEKIRKLELGL